MNLDIPKFDVSDIRYNLNSQQSEASNIYKITSHNTKKLQCSKPDVETVYNQCVCV